MNRNRCPLKTSKGRRCRLKKYSKYSVCYSHFKSKKLNMSYIFLVHQILTKRSYNKNLFIVICSYLRRIPEYNFNINLNDELILKVNMYRNDSIYYVQRVIARETFIDVKALANCKGEIINENLLIDETDLHNYDNLSIIANT